MGFRADADVELSGIVLSRRQTFLFALVEEDLQRNMALVAETLNIGGIEVRATVQANELPRNISISGSY